MRVAGNFSEPSTSGAAPVRTAASPSPTSSSIASACRWRQLQRQQSLREAWTRGGGNEVGGDPLELVQRSMPVQREMRSRSGCDGHIAAQDRCPGTRLDLLQPDALMAALPHPRVLRADERKSGKNPGVPIRPQSRDTAGFGGRTAAHLELPDFYRWRQ